MEHSMSLPSDEAVDMGLKMLMTSVPGVPGEDYPIYAEVPESAFSCEGQVEGGYYADEEAECQVFHICAAEEAKYSFLCPNGTIFNQENFICDWWFNVDCAESAAIAEAKTVSWQPPGKQQAPQLQRLLPLMSLTPTQHPREATLPLILQILDPGCLDTRPSIQ